MNRKSGIVKKTNSLLHIEYKAEEGEDVPNFGIRVDSDLTTVEGLHGYEPTEKEAALWRICGAEVQKLLDELMELRQHKSWSDQVIAGGTRHEFEAMQEELESLKKKMT